MWEKKSTSTPAPSNSSTLNQLSDDGTNLLFKGSKVSPALSTTLTNLSDDGTNLLFKGSKVAPTLSTTLTNLSDDGTNLLFKGQKVGGSGGTVTLSSPWSGKHWYALGDSLTAHYLSATGYTDYVSQMLNMTCHNYGITGNLLCADPQESNPMVTRYRDIDASVANLITVWGGANDYIHDAELGTYGSQNSANFYGALYNLCTGLYVNYPNAKYAFFTIPKGNLAGAPTGGPNGKGYTAKQYNDAIKQICADFSIPVLDLNAMSGLNPLIPNISTQYYVDGGHPNPAGHQRLADKIAPFLNTL
jgi:lysophospholipase L1-like esterase